MDKIRNFQIIINSTNKVQSLAKEEICTSKNLVLLRRAQRNMF